VLTRKLILLDKTNSMSNQTPLGKPDSFKENSSKPVDEVWSNLVRWVQGGSDSNSSSDSNCGYVHRSLVLQGIGPSRGVVATASIPKGELLIRIRSENVLSGAATATAKLANETNSTTKASPWLKCVGAFLKAKRDQAAGHSADSLSYRPYLDSLPEEYETLHNWTLSDEVTPFLKGTTLGNLVTIDKTTKGIQTRYRNSVEPYLRNVGAIDSVAEDTAVTQSDDKAIETNADYQAFLEASMCISTRGFHLLPTTSINDESKEETNTGGAVSNNNTYDGPFLLPVIDLLNHNPQKACTTLRRYPDTETSGNKSCFVMVAERDIAKGEEVFHSYGADLTSAQLLQTFGFVPREHSSDAVATISRDPPIPSLESTTPVGLSTKTHLLAAAKSLKASTFPDTLMDRIQKLNGQSPEMQDVEEDEEDCCWEVCDIPDRPNMASEDEFLVSTSQARESNEEFLLTDDMITLLSAQFLPEEAFDEIFPSGDSASNTVQLDRSILVEDYYLGMLVCKSLLVAFFLKARDYGTDADGETKTEEDSADFVAKAISGAAPPGFFEKFISSLLKNETARLQGLLKATNEGKTTTTSNADREIYGRTIRIEELTNLWAFCHEIEELMAKLSPGEGVEIDESTIDTKRARDSDIDSPHKRAKAE